MGKAMKVERRRQKWFRMESDGFRIVFEGRFLFAKRRWADKALEWAGIPEKERSMWAEIPVPGSNVVMFTPPPDQDVWEMRRKYVEAARAHQQQLNQILDVPIEEADGTTVLEEKAPKRRKGA